MAETTEYERAQIMDSPTHDLDFLMRLIRDASRLQRAEELLRGCQSRIPRNKAENTELHREIEQYFGRKP